jgi:hypothetical protein
MDPLPALDLLLSDRDLAKDRLLLAAEAAIAAAVGDLAAIEVLDRSSRATDWLSGPRSVAAAIRRQYEAWLTAAESLQQRVEQVKKQAGSVEGSDRLEQAVGRTLARLAVSLEELAAAVQEGRAGQVRRFASVEEMRRELLHPRVHP